MPQQATKRKTNQKRPSLVEKARIAILVSILPDYTPHGWFVPMGTIVSVIKERIFRCTGMKDVKLRLVNERNRYIFTGIDEECYFFNERTGVVTKVEKPMSYRKLVMELEKEVPMVQERLGVPGTVVGMTKVWREKEPFLRNWNRDGDGGGGQPAGVNRRDEGRARTARQ